MAVTMNLFDILAFVLLVYLVRCVYVSSDRGPVPPGPRGWPIIGNLFDMPAGHQWQTFALCGHKWGMSDILLAYYIHSILSVPHRRHRLDQHAWPAYGDSQLL